MPILEPKYSGFIGIPILSNKEVFGHVLLPIERINPSVISGLQFLCPKITCISARPELAG